MLEWLGYTKLNKGKTSGSRVKFIKGNKPIYLHKPHPRKNLLKYQVKDLKSNLRGEI
ncbi:type II toxin-antitoxin system HicA family toxin [Lactobacillus crispatus]|uniref:type II toxin-antitoxin system HicA family toxin n=1 Tax=Lactobacillus crispatus TaxID=47770 RepID=UPI0002EE0F99